MSPGSPWRLLLTAGLALSPAANYAQPVLQPANAASGTYGDDVMTSTPYSIYQMTTTCPWVVTGLNNNNFTAANGWNITWAPAATDQRVLQDVSVVNNGYYAWVGNQPTYTDPNNKKWGGNLVNGEGGGAYLQLSLNATAGNPLMGQTVHWVQAYQDTVRGVGPNVALDIKAGAANPWYDTSSAAGQTYFVDAPFDTEQEYENNPISDVQLQVFLAVDSGAGGGFAHNVTIYGGDWWGYQLSAVDVPEPSALAIGSLGLVGLVVRRWRRKRALLSGAH